MEEYVNSCFAQRHLKKRKVLAENDIVVREYCNLHGLWEN
ncbi:desulfoferrodoxin family protein [Methanobrevibacter sp.]